jgi:GNAT superfamily N-acetyltransferase
MSTLFRHSDKLDPGLLRFEPFRTDNSQIKTFDCGNKDLNDFLCTDEVMNYEEEMLGKTTLVYYKGELTGYYTLSSTSLGVRYLEHKTGFGKLSEYHVNELPALLIGRLAIDLRWQKRGVGRYIVQRIAMLALDQSRNQGIRLLVVQAKEDAFEFYTKCGFDFVMESRNEMKRFKARGTRTMFFDVASLKYLQTK